MKKVLLATIGAVLLSGAAVSPVLAEPLFDVPPPVAPLVDGSVDSDGLTTQATYTRE